MSKQNQKQEANIYDKVFKENIDAVIDNFIRKILKLKLYILKKLLLNYKELVNEKRIIWKK